MAQSHLSDRRIDLGKAVLARLDRCGFQPDSALWLYSEQMGGWRYYVVSQMADEIGRFPVYQTLLRLYPELELPKGFNIFDLHVVGHDDPQVSAITRVVHQRGGRATIAADTGYGDRLTAYVYRLNKAPRGVKAKAARAAFAKRVRKLTGGRRRMLQAAE
jgi:hypothetical protein